MADFREENAVSTGFYLSRMIILCIPIVNVIAALVWAFTGSSKESRNFGKAGLFTILIVTAVVAALGLVSFFMIKNSLLMQI
jgi:hypothetical protein